jgi:hypothetical protein
MGYGIHPNEQAFTAMIIKENLQFKPYLFEEYIYNPITFLRKGTYPSQKLRNEPIPESVRIVHYHKPW